MAKKADVLIVGGGVIGISTAYYLLKNGRGVTILEKGKVGSGSSYGNAGWIVPSYSVPLASPGALSHGLKWLLDRSSPFYIKPRPSIELLRWLWQFRSASNEKTMRRSIPVLRDMSRLSLALFDELVEGEGLDCHYHRRGLLTVFRSRSELRGGKAEAALLQEHGIPVQMLSPAEVQDMAPFVRPGVVGGMFSPEDAHIDPAGFLFAMADRVRTMGAEIVTGAEVQEFRTDGRKVTVVETSIGGFAPAQVVLAAGAWSSLVAKGLGIRIPVQAAKGYSVTVERPDGFPELPMMLGETKVAVTPLEKTLRFAGTLELAGIELSISQRRVNAILNAARTYLALEPLHLPMVEVWRGLRLCTPDGLPIIGKAPALENLIIATGHCMLGLSLGPVTGLLVSQIASGERPELPLDPLRPDRF